MLLNTDSLSELFRDGTICADAFRNLDTLVNICKLKITKGPEHYEQYFMENIVNGCRSMTLEFNVFSFDYHCPFTKTFGTLSELEEIIPRRQA
jgi:hypothetical protein